MKSSLIAAKLVGFALAAALASPATAQSKPSSFARTYSADATIRSVRALASEDGWAVEVISTRPLVPSLSRAENPPRLIIDLPNAHLANIQGRLAFQSSGIAGVRISQFQISVARIVLDLARPVRYSWDAAGNRLTIRVHPAESPPHGSSGGGSAAIEPVALPVAATESTNSTVVVTSGTLLPGSSVTAGADATSLRLSRGGEVRVCPGTTVSVTPSQSGRSLMLAMSTGALEAHYSLGASADSILTPDFRILLAGPGEFDYAISTDLRGNTCVRALPGNRTSLTVSELLADGSYQVMPNEQAVFRSGHLQPDAARAPGSCGCPPAMPAVLRTSAPGTTPDLKEPPAAAGAPTGPYNREAESTKLADRQPFPAETAMLPPSKPDDIHVQVDSSFVFRASDPANVPPAPSEQAEVLPARSLSRPALDETVLSPARPGLHHGFLGKIRGFFSAVFG
jgi:AMIN domain